MSNIIRLDRPLVTPPGMMKWWKQIFDGEYDVIDMYLKHGVETVVDVGACIGAFALWADKRFPGCGITCYEPNPLNFEALVKNTEHIRTISRSNVALSDKHGYEELVVPAGNIGAGSTFIDIENLYKGEVAKFQVETVPGWVIPECDFLKLDCEGAELSILRSIFLDGGKKKPGAVVLEYHTDGIAKEIQGLMVMQGYYLVESFPTFQGTYCVGIQKWVLP